MSPDDLLTLDEAVKLIADRVQTDEEGIRATRNRVSHFIQDNVEKGKLKQRADERFVLKVLIQWAKKHKKWHGKLDDLPALNQIEATSVISYEIPPSDNLEACQTEVRELHKERAALKAENSKLKTAAEECDRKRAIKQKSGSVKKTKAY